MTESEYEKCVGTEFLAARTAADLYAHYQDMQIIFIWDFSSAPVELQALSPHGGDEDHLALIPPWFEGKMHWADSREFGCCDTSEHFLPNGWRVLIGAHA